MEGGTDRLGLSERKLFQILREHLPNVNPKTRNIIECKEDILFVWNSKDTCLLTVNVKTSKDGSVDIPTHQVRKNLERNQYGIRSPTFIKTVDINVLLCSLSQAQRRYTKECNT